MNSAIRDNATFIPQMAELARTLDKTAHCPWLSAYRQAQIAAFERAQFPNQKVEHFKYNRLDIFSEQHFNRPAGESAPVVAGEREIDDLSKNNAVEQLVFVNGSYDAALSTIKSHRLTHFADANAKQQKTIVDMLTGQAIAHNPFIQYNACATDHGVLIEVDTDSPDVIIEIVHIIGSGAANAALATQVLIDIADNSRATVVSRSLNWFFDDSNSAFSTQRFIANIGTNAQLDHYQLQLENAHAVHFGAAEYNLYTNATLKAFHGATGGHLKKMDITVNHRGQHAHAFLDGLYAATDSQQIDFHTTVNHPLPNGQTDEVFRGIVNGQAEATFNGRIHIFADAQKTRAELSNKNLILSDSAQIHTKPELEIYADDVVCAHGATVSRLDTESLNYLRARGIPKSEAELMLSYGFFNEILDELAHAEIADYLRPILFKRFE